MWEKSSEAPYGESTPLPAGGDLCGRDREKTDLSATGGHGAPTPGTRRRPTWAHTRNRLPAAWEPDAEARASGRECFFNSQKAFEIESETNKPVKR